MLNRASIMVHHPIVTAAHETYRNLWKITIKIVDFPMNFMVLFHSYVNVYQRVSSPWFSQQDLFKVDGIVFSCGFSSYPYESNMI